MRTKNEIPIVALQVQYWCRSLCFLAPGIVSSNFRNDKMHLSAILSHFCATWWPHEDKNEIRIVALQVQFWCRFLCFFAPGIVSSNFRNDNMHLSATLGHFWTIFEPHDGQKCKILAYTYRVRLGVEGGMVNNVQYTFDFSECWTLSGWTLLDIIGHYWTLLDIYSLFHRNGC